MASTPLDNRAGLPPLGKDVRETARKAYARIDDKEGLKSEETKLTEKIKNIEQKVRENRKTILVYQSEIKKLKEKVRILPFSRLFRPNDKITRLKGKIADAEKAIIENREKRKCFIYIKQALEERIAELAKRKEVEPVKTSALEIKPLSSTHKKEKAEFRTIAEKHKIRKEEAKGVKAPSKAHAEKERAAVAEEATMRKVEQLTKGEIRKKEAKLKKPPSEKKAEATEKKPDFLKEMKAKMAAGLRHVVIPGDKSPSRSKEPELSPEQQRMIAQQQAADKEITDDVDEWEEDEWEASDEIKEVERTLSKEESKATKKQPIPEKTKERIEEMKIEHLSKEKIEKMKAERDENLPELRRVQERREQIAGDEEEEEEEIDFE